MKVEGTPYLCKTDEVGEICVNSIATGAAYYGLPGITKNIFEVRAFPDLCVEIQLHKCSAAVGWTHPVSTALGQADLLGAHSYRVCSPDGR